MTAFILLKGKDLAIPDGASTAIIGLFFGLICGLFYYQHYYKTYFWFISLGGGLALTYISQFFFVRLITDDDASALRLTIAEFIVPFVFTLILNHGLYLIKKNKRKKRKHQRNEGHTRALNTRFFDSPDSIVHDSIESQNSNQVLSGTIVPTGKDIAK
jgi:hypothetical protein